MAISHLLLFLCHRLLLALGFFLLQVITFACILKTVSFYSEHTQICQSSGSANSCSMQTKCHHCFLLNILYKFVLQFHPFLPEPNRPESVKVTGQGTETASFSWAAPLDSGFDGYKITINGATYNIDKDVTTYDASGLRPSAQFQFQIVVTVGTGTDTISSDTVTISATTG